MGGAVSDFFFCLTVLPGPWWPVWTKGKTVLALPIVVFFFFPLCFCFPAVGASSCWWSFLPSFFYLFPCLFPCIFLDVFLILTCLFRSFIHRAYGCYCLLLIVLFFLFGWLVPKHKDMCSSLFFSCKKIRCRWLLEACTFWFFVAWAFWSLLLERFDREARKNITKKGSSLLWSKQGCEPYTDGRG